MGPGAQHTADRPECRAEPAVGVELSAPGRGVRVVVAVAGGVGRCGAGAAVVPVAAAVERGASGARLGRGAPGTEGRGRDTGVVVGRVQGGEPQRLSLSVQHVLPVLPALASLFHLISKLYERISIAGYEPGLRGMAQRARRAARTQRAGGGWVFCLVLSRLS